MKKLSMGVCLAATVLGWGLSVGVAPADAQTSNNPNSVNPDTAPGSGSQPTTPFLPPPASTGTPGVTAATPSGSLYDTVTTSTKQLGQTLQGKGIYLQLGYAENFNAAVSGGVKTGIQPNGELFYGAVLDLQTMAGLTGSSLHFIMTERNGLGTAALAGTDNYGVQTNAGPFRPRLSELFWEQAIDEDRIDITFGRTNPTLDFATSDIACQFISGIFCAQPGAWYNSNRDESYPAAEWGGRVNIVLVPNVYFRVGVFDDDPTQGDFASDGGFTWNVKGSVGAFVPAEVGYAKGFSETQYPFKYDVGGYWDDANYTTPQGFDRRGRTAFWVQGLQTIWRPDPKTNQSLQLFGGAMIFGKDTPYWSEVYGGLFDRGPVLARPNDTVGFVASYFANNSIEQVNKPSQWVFEANYGARIIPGLTFKPYVEYIISPNNALHTYTLSEPKNSTTVGFQVALDVAALMGFPVFQPH